MKSLFAPTSGATFSDCGKYRYSLWRCWSSGPWINFLMLNPSTADETTNDPTIERCQRRAVAMGFGGLIVTNLFAFRATKPRDMKAAADPIGPENDRAILTMANGKMVVCAWGNDGRHRGRSAAVVKLLRAAGAELCAFKFNDNGEPGHPLFLAYTVRPELWKGGE